MHVISALFGYPHLLSLFVVAALSLSSAAISFAQSSPQDYPQWRGRTRDGSASSFIEPKTWPEKLTRKWQIEVGEGYATPIVVGKRVYTFTRRGDNEVMMALDAATGEVLWQTGYKSPPLTSGSVASKHGNGPKATPLFCNGRLYTLGLSGTVSAFDAATGKLVWQIPAPPETPYYGMAVSPLADKDLVIVTPGGNGPLTAVDAKTGDIKWKSTGDSAWASPIVVELGGIRQIISMTTKSVISVSVTDGRLLWEHPWVSGGTASTMTPIVYGETIIVNSQRMPVTALKPVQRDGKWTVAVVWEAKEVSMFMSNPVLIGETLFGLSERASGQYFAIDARTGKVLWLGEPREATNTAVVKAGDLLFLLNDDAELIVARSSRTEFKPMRRYTVADSATWAQPAISGNRMFIKDAASLALWIFQGDSPEKSQKGRGHKEQEKSRLF
jgi:outer membrane protein assembly factor BamB